jgi:glycosyltransferase involved in cell wall biosynthesis
MATSPLLVTVVITCYNHGEYLSEAIESVLKQTYTPVEIIVVDDGSTDNTKEVASRYSGIQYVYQSNQGLSAARNTGADHSSRDCILFLDADDWLLPQALSINVQYLEKNREAAFVSGAFKVLKMESNEEILMQTAVSDNHYNRLLEFNYISMHATVLYRRWVFNEFKFDTSLKACEDYDFYLRVARKYPVLHHTEFIAVYRFHDLNMSYDTVKMMNASIAVIKKQESYLHNEAQKKSYKKGIKNFKLFYCKVIYAKYLLPKQKNNPNRSFEMKMLWQNSKAFYFKFYVKKFYQALKNFYKRHESK